MAQDRNGYTIDVGLFAVKSGGDYVFQGTVRCIFAKESGEERIVVENKDGVLHIFNPKQVYIPPT